MKQLWKSLNKANFKFTLITFLNINVLYFVSYVYDILSYDTRYKMQETVHKCENTQDTGYKFVYQGRVRIQDTAHQCKHF